MIRQALLHFRGLGPARIAALEAQGVRTWDDIVDKSSRLPEALRDDLVREATALIEAHEQGRIGYLVERLHPADHWRILDEYLESAAFFDIETTGLESDAAISVICCYANRRIESFVEYVNLDDFLAFLEDVSLLVSFNGSTFDVPRVLDAFHIPELPCPHLDLRWICRRQGHVGGLKQVTRRLGIERPREVAAMSGEDAVDLSWRWLLQRDETAKRELVRYCSADVMLLRRLSEKVLWGLGVGS